MGGQYPSGTGVAGVSPKVGHPGTFGSSGNGVERILDCRSERSGNDGRCRHGYRNPELDRGLRGRPFLDLDPVDLAWLSGLLEGEGYFGLVNNRVNGNLYRYARIGLTMTDRDVVERVACYFNRRMRANKPSKPGGRPQFRITLQGSRAIELMKILHPHMGERRRKQIDDVLAFEALRPNPNQGRREWSTQEAASRERDSKGRLLRRKSRV